MRNSNTFKVLASALFTVLLFTIIFLTNRVFDDSQQKPKSSIQKGVGEPKPPTFDFTNRKNWHDMVPTHDGHRFLKYFLPSLETEVDVIAAYKSAAFDREEGDWLGGQWVYFDSKSLTLTDIMEIGDADKKHFGFEKPRPYYKGNDVSRISIGLKKGPERIVTDFFGEIANLTEINMSRALIFFDDTLQQGVFFYYGDWILED